MIDNKISMIAVVGPTASGKTKLSIEIAKSFNGEIISADSIQIYKSMNIATAKPTIEEMQGIPHHLIDFLDISKEFNVLEYVNMAKSCILDINKRGKTPIVVGGTGLYIDSLLNNITFLNSKVDLELRNKLSIEAANYGGEYLLKKLAKFDKESAVRIHPNNVKRIIRAIEIYYTTGVTMTNQIRNSKNIESPYNSYIIGLSYKNRELLCNKINKRVDNMIENGLIAEAKKILDMKCSKTAMNAIGYKELIPFFNKEMSLDQAIDRIKIESRRYSKRQLTWFKRNKNIHWFYIDEFDNFNVMYHEVLKSINNQNIIKI